MFDNKYPYSDFHELNLDWFLEKFKELVATWEQVQSDWNSLHDFVQNYFDNLNVQAEINNKINAMIADGSFALILTPLVEVALPTIVDGKLPAVVASQIGAVVASQIGAVVAGQLPAVAAQAAADEVGTWLAEHIDPDTGYVIDTSFTVSNAAADAKTVGYRFKNIDDAVSVVVKNQYSDTDYRTSGIFTRENGSATTSSNDVIVTSNNTYYTYHMEIQDDTEIYFDAVPTSTYISICVLEGYSGTSTSGSNTTYSGTGSVRYRSSDSNLPTSLNKLRVNQGDYIFITASQVNPGYDHVYGAEGINYDYSDQLKTDLPKKCCCIYDNTVSGKEIERLNIYLPAKAGYTKVNFCHAIDVDINCNIWLIHPLYAVDDNFINQYQVTVPGEFECALHVTGESDFMGGTSHGDEILDEAVFFIDNAMVNPEDITSLTKFSELKIYVKSLLYDADDHTRLRAYHAKEYIFKNNTITLNQVVEWAMPTYVVDSYMAMFPVIKNITPKIITNRNYDIKTFAVDGYFSELGTTKAISFSTNFNATFEILDWDIEGTNLQDTGKFLVTDNGGLNYNKQYFCCTSAGHVDTGDKWRTTTKYTFEV